MKRIPPSERTREAIRTLLNEGTTEAGSAKSDLLRMATRLILEEALEAKVSDLLGREYYKRDGGEGSGHRNGHRERSLKTAEGDVRYAVPQVRDTDTSAITAFRQHLQGRSGELERLAVEMYARGCSTRDIEAMFRCGDGKSLLSRSAVSEITEALWTEYEDFATRDLSDVKPLYLFLDGVAERLRPGAKREAVLSAWCITWGGKKVLIHIAPGTKESTECCRDFLEELKRRGLADPLVTITDGAPGLIRAVEECFPASLRQRCLAHRMRNLESKLPEEIRAEFKQAAKAAYQAPSVAMARALREDLVERFANRCPTAVRCFEDDFDACIAHLHTPPAHHRTIRTSNLLERLFGEERRRMKIVPTMFGERPVLKLMYASLIRATENWRGISISEFENRQLKNLRDELIKRHRDETQPAVKPASTPNRIYSKDRT
jgi:transposase-like protein